MDINYLLVEDYRGSGYGIAATEGNVVLESICNPMFTKVEMEELLSLFNKCGLSLCHFQEQMDDCLKENLLKAQYLEKKTA